MSAIEPTTTVCSYCDKRFALSRRSGRFKRAGGAYHEASRFCGPACKQAAYRARHKRNAPTDTGLVERVTAAEGAYTHTTVTRPSEPIETTREFRTEKTTEPPLNPDPLLVRDETYPNMWRVRLPGGELTDMVNYTRAADCARIMRENEHKPKWAPR